jgi:hypothetical protein
MNAATKTDQDLTLTISVDQTPQEAYEAINDVRAWWTGEIEGPTDELGGEFTYRYRPLHFSKHKIAELVPGKRVVWLIVDSRLEFVADKTEWTGTRVVFDIARNGDKTEVRFTHEGLEPANECYGDCSAAWTGYVRGSLKKLIETRARPNASAASTP